MKFSKFKWLAGVMLVTILISSCNIGSTPAPAEDPGAIQTQAFEIVLTQAASQQTQTAAALPPTAAPTNTVVATNTLPALPTSGLFSTNTPFALNTQQPGLTPLVIGGSPTVGVIGTTTTKNGCNDGYLISESGPYDGKTILIGTVFDKSWEFINTGTCTWDEGYTFAFIEEFSTGGRYVKDYTIPKGGEFIKPGATVTFTVTLKVPKEPGEYIWYYKLRDDAGQYFGSLVWTKLIAVKE